MIKIFFIIIILFIVFSHFFNYNNKVQIYRIDKNIKKKNNIKTYNNIDRNFKDNIDSNFKDTIDRNFKDNINIWSKVIDNKYYIKIKPLTLDDYTNWKMYIDNTDIVDDLYFDPNIGELIIISNNENIVIVVAHAILNNFNGTTNFEDSKRLLNENIKKIHDDDTFKHKLITNIYNKLYQNININEHNMKENKKHIKKFNQSDTNEKFNKSYINEKFNQSDINNKFNQSDTNEKFNQSDINDKFNQSDINDKFNQSDINDGQMKYNNIGSLNNAKILTIPNNQPSDTNIDIDIEAFNDDFDAFDNNNYSYIE